MFLEYEWLLDLIDTIFASLMCSAGRVDRSRIDQFDMRCFRTTLYSRVSPVESQISCHNTKN